MKSTILITCVLACALQLPAQDAPKPAAKKQESATADGQAEAIRKYPELGKTGSSFNVEFISRVKRYQKEKPDFFKDPAWPMKLADEVAESGKVAGPGQKAPGNAGASKTAATVPASKPAGEPASLDRPRWIGKAKAGSSVSVLQFDLKGDLFVLVSQNGPEDTGIAKLSGKDGTLSWTIQRSDIDNDAADFIASFLHQSGDLIIIGKLAKPNLGKNYFVARIASANGKVMWTLQRSDIDKEWTLQRSDFDRDSEGNLQSFLHSSGDLMLIGRLAKANAGEDHFVARIASANGKVMWTQILHIIVDDFHPSLFHSMDTKGDLYFGGLTSTSPLNKGTS